MVARSSHLGRGEAVSKPSTASITNISFKIFVKIQPAYHHGLNLLMLNLFLTLSTTWPESPARRRWMATAVRMIQPRMGKTSSMAIRTTKLFTTCMPILSMLEV